MIGENTDRKRKGYRIQMGSEGGKIGDNTVMEGLDSRGIRGGRIGDNTKRKRRD